MLRMSFSVFRGKNYCFAICSNFFEKLFFALHSLPFCPFFSVFQHNAIFCSQPSLTLSLQTNVFYPLANSYQRIFEQQNTAVFKHFWQAFCPGMAWVIGQVIGSWLGWAAWGLITFLENTWSTRMLSMSFSVLGGKIIVLRFAATFSKNYFCPAFSALLPLLFCFSA